MTAVRRVVVGLDDAHRVAVLDDGPSPHVVDLPAVPGLTLTDLWYTDETPAVLAGTADPADRPLSVAPGPQGSLFRVVDFPSDASLADVDGGAAIAALGGGGSTDDPPTPTTGADAHLMWHQTDTIDFNIVLSGVLSLVHERGRIDLAAGDTLVVKGIRHAWSNPGAGPCRLACVSVAAVSETRS